jgi:hypothetical protein
MHFLRKHPSLWLFLACLAGFAAYAAWVFHKSSAPDAGWTALRHAWPFLLAGVATVAAVIGFFVWLAVYSDKKGYDARIGHDDK